MMVVAESRLIIADEKACCGCDEYIGHFEQGIAGEFEQSCKHDLGVFVDTTVAPITRELPDDQAYYEAFEYAFGVINRTCDVTLRRVEEGRHRIRCEFGATRGSVLAFSDVGGRCRTEGYQRYGRRWDWTREQLIEVVLHELGHILGLGHDVCRADGENVVMCPTISTPYRVDFDRRTANFLVRIYGESQVEDPEEPDDPEEPEEPNLNWERIIQLILAIITAIGQMSQDERDALNAMMDELDGKKK